MSFRNQILANELVRVMVPSAHNVAVQKPESSDGETIRRIVGKIETCLNTHNKTNFTDVCAFNELIGNPMGAANIDQVLKQFDLIDSEMGELRAGIERLKDAAKMLASPSEDDRDQAEFDRDAAVMEIRDGIADVLVTTYGLAHRMGIDADKDMLAVSTSNASKFFTGTEGDAAATCKALADSLGIKVEQRQAADLQQTTEEGEAVCVWAFVSADDTDPERPRGKLLKAPGYKSPVFD